MTPLTPNQVVALNLTNERRRRRLTQAEFCEVLAPYLGVLWSPAVLSAVERSVDGKRIREFTADEIIAIARLFGESVSYVLSPPADVEIVTPDHPDGLPREEAAVIMNAVPTALGLESIVKRLEDALKTIDGEASSEAK